MNRLLVGLGFAIVPFEDVETTAYGWPIIPEGLADAVAGLYELYGDALPPLSVIDNGMGDLDLVDATGRSDDDRRRALLRARLSWLAGLTAAGVEVCGYEYWSVLDNLEAKFRYTRLYAMAVPDHEAPPRPPMPSDWLQPRRLRRRRRTRSGAGRSSRCCLALGLRRPPSRLRAQDAGGLVVPAADQPHRRVDEDVLVPLVAYGDPAGHHAPAGLAGGPASPWSPRRRTGCRRRTPDRWTVSSMCRKARPVPCSTFVCSTRPSAMQ